MHIAEGALSGTPEGVAVLIVGWTATAVGTAIGLHKMDYEQVPQIALLSCTFFVVSLIPIPLGVTTAHLVLSGLVGLVLGWTAFPAILVALILQTQIAGIGGPTTLGINTLVMAAPAVLCHYLFSRWLDARQHWLRWSVSFLAGSLAVLLGATLNALAIGLAGVEFHWVAGTAFVVHLAIAPVEGVITAMTVGFLHKVRPEMLTRSTYGAHPTPGVPAE